MYVYGKHAYVYLCGLVFIQMDMHAFTHVYWPGNGGRLIVRFGNQIDMGSNSNSTIYYCMSPYY